MKKFKIAIGSDHAGFELKEKVKLRLEELGHGYYDMGAYDKTSADYPVIARGIALEVADGKYDRGIIICGSGIGVAIAANKIKEIRAANCNDLYSAKMSRLHNDANVLCMGGRVIGEDLAYEIVKIWLSTEFEGGRHQKRVDMI
ncbi:MAG TPA: ribose 5-phosphate isomerase B [Candidatus Gastranaerophilales bacterium]|nr:ribose 5-phosphate isomerase B [Candidatus Gastranaerophilales bacterium]